MKGTYKITNVHPPKKLKTVTSIEKLRVLNIRSQLSVSTKRVQNQRRSLNY